MGDCPYCHRPLQESGVTHDRITMTEYYYESGKETEYFCCTRLDCSTAAFMLGPREEAR